jgi:hypothetical protein
LFNFCLARGQGVHVLTQLLASSNYSGLKSAHFCGARRKLGVHEGLQFCNHCICLMHVRLYGFHLYPLVQCCVLRHLESHILYVYRQRDCR